MCYSEHSPDPSVQVTSFLTPAKHQSQSHDWDIKDTGYCRQDIDKFKQIYNHVLSSGQPNYCGARIIIPSGLNIPIWREYLSNSCYHDVAVCDMLAYGFPLNYCRDVYPITIPGNHPSAVQFPGHVDAYLDTEIRHGALLGPFTTPPIANVHISPLMSRPKRQSSLRRIILDLSWPIGYSVNSGIPTDTYLGEPYKLHLPTIDDLVQLVLQQGHGCYLYSHDISRAYRQIRCCPLDWALLGIQWRNMYYLDIAIPFGVRIGAMACSRMSQAICHIMNNEGLCTLSYIDDFAGVQTDYATALKGFTRLRNLFTELGVSEARDKAIPPTTTLTWIGIEIDTMTMEMRMPKQKICDALVLVNDQMIGAANSVVLKDN